MKSKINIDIVWDGFQTNVTVSGDTYTEKWTGYYVCADRDAKAVEAYRTSCERFYHGWCGEKLKLCSNECDYVQEFIEKLNED